MRRAEPGLAMCLCAGIGRALSLRTLVRGAGGRRLLGSYSPFYVVPVIAAVVVASGFALFRAIVNAYQKKWRKALSLLILPIAVAVTFRGSAPRGDPLCQVG